MKHYVSSSTVDIIVAFSYFLSEGNVIEVKSLTKTGRRAITAASFLSTSFLKGILECKRMPHDNSLMYRHFQVQCKKEEFSSNVNGLVQVQKRREEVESRTREND